MGSFTVLPDAFRVPYPEEATVFGFSFFFRIGEQWYVINAEEVEPDKVSWSPTKEIATDLVYEKYDEVLNFRRRHKVLKPWIAGVDEVGESFPDLEWERSPEFKTFVYPNGREKILWAGTYWDYE